MFSVGRGPMFNYLQANDSPQKVLAHAIVTRTRQGLHLIAVKDPGPYIPSYMLDIIIIPVAKIGSGLSDWITSCDEPYRNVSCRGRFPALASLERCLQYWYTSVQAASNAVA